MNFLEDKETPLQSLPAATSKVEECQISTSLNFTDASFSVDSVYSSNYAIRTFDSLGSLAMRFSRADLQDEEEKMMREAYDLKSEEIGQGATSVVYRCYKRETGEECAAKIIKRRKFSDELQKSEIDILKSLSHPYYSFY